MQQLLEDIKAGLEDVLATDDSGNEIGETAYLDVEIVDLNTVAVQTRDGHRFFVEVQQHD